VRPFEYVIYAIVVVGLLYVLYRWTRRSPQAEGGG